MGVIYIIVAGIAAVTLGSHYLKKGAELTLSETLGVLMLFIVAICLAALTTVVVLVNFHKSLYGEQGYLTFTLPVKSWKLLLSKVIMATVWFVLAFAAIFGSMYVIYFVCRDELIGQDAFDVLSSMLAEVADINISGVIVTVIAKLILAFITFSFYILTIFFTSTLANTRLFQSHNVLWTILLFLPIMFVSNKIAVFINQRVVFTLFFIDDKIKLVTDNLEYQSLYLTTNGIDLGSIFVYLVLGVALFFATHFIMSKKVNIK